MKHTLSAEEAKTKLYGGLAEATGWNYLKSRNCLKKTVQDLVFEILFFSSKWNTSDQIVDINAEFVFWCKAYGKSYNINTFVGSMSYHPKKQYWYDISTQKKLEKTLKELTARISETAVDLSCRFENDYMGTVRALLNPEFDSYNIQLDFIADKLGAAAVKNKAQEIYDHSSDEEKQQLEDYKNGIRNKAWMLNRCNLKYIADHDLYKT